MTEERENLRKNMKEFYSKSKPYLEQLKKHDLNVFRKYIEKILQYCRKESKIVDVGCGIGQVANFLASKGYNVTGIDISPLFIKEARKSGKATFLVMSATELDFEDNSFDCAISAETIEHVVYPDKMLSEMSRVVKPGGLVILRFPNTQDKIKQIKTMITGRTLFEIKKPNLAENVYGEDEDLCHLASTADILTFLKRKNFKILWTKPFFWRAGLIVARKKQLF